MIIIIPYSGNVFGGGKVWQVVVRQTLTSQNLAYKWHPYG